MLLSAGDMSELLGVSRVTYYGWVRGRPIRATNDASARAVVRKMLRLVTSQQWPTPEARADRKGRKEKLAALLKD